MTRKEAIDILISTNIWNDEEMTAWKVLVPELAETEDERMLREIKRYIKEQGDKPNGLPNGTVAVSDMIAWLEKQKEPHLELNAGKWYICHRAFCARADHLTVKEGERFQCEKDGIVKGFVIKEPEKYFKECSAPEPMEKEQKPVESISQQTVQGKGVYKICPRCKERMIRDDSMVYTSMPPQYRYECPKCGESECDTVMYDSPETEEQKPAEWSEEDEKIWNHIIDCAEGRAWIPFNEISWLVAHKPQSHWKPSDENERMRKGLINFLRSSFIKENITDETVAPWIAYLERQKPFVTIPATEIVKNEPMEMPSGKSLDALADVVQAKDWKPSEEQQEMEPLTKLEKAVFDMLVERTNEITISEKQARKYAPIFLEIAKGKHWKPTEKQIEAIKNALNFYSESTDTYQHLKSLLSELVKL